MSAIRVLPVEDADQRLRLKRFFMALASYLMAIALVGVYYSQGLVQPRGFYIAVAAIVLANVGIYAVLRSGLNRRFPDPSLTGVQIMTANVLLMVTFYVVDEGRGALLLLYLVTFIFGVFRLRTWQFLVLGGFGLVAYAVTIALLTLTRPEAVNLQRELTQWVALAFVLPWFALIGGYISGLRRRLRQSKDELEEAVGRIHDLAIHDDLTGIHNRRYIMELLEHELARAGRQGQSTGLLLLDLDHFKQVNDRYGHYVGDLVLKRVARRVGQVLRPADGFGRCGGEEFIVVMSDADARAAQAAGERIRRQVSETDLSDLANALRVTTSVGVTDCLPGETPTECFQRADRALYAAKAAGRDRVEVQASASAQVRIHSTTRGK